MIVTEISFVLFLIYVSFSSQILSRSSSIGSTSDVDSNSSRPETRAIKKETRESIHSNSSSYSLKSERKIQSNISSHSKTEETIPNTDDENVRTATVTKMRPPEEELLRVSTPDINNEDT